VGQGMAVQLMNIHVIILKEITLNLNAICKL